MSTGRPPGRREGEWLVATMVYSSTREAKVPGFDRWYWELLGKLPGTRKLLLVAGAYDSDNTIKELLEEARKRAIPATVHFIERGPLRKAYETQFSHLASLVEDLDSFAEKNEIVLDDGELKLDF